MLLILLVPLGLLTVGGVVALWPGELPDLGAELGTVDDLVDARVVEVERGPCPGTTAELRINCAFPTVELLEGPDAGQTLRLGQPLSEAPGSPTVEEGERIVLSYQAGPDPDFRYAFSDRERRTPLFVLGGLFVIAVLLLGRLQGLRALIGLGLSFGIMVVFVLPAVLDGQNPLAVALVGSSLIAFVSLYLAHGLNARTTTALLGSLASLALVGLLGALFVAWSRFTGFADEDALFLNIASGQIDLQGLLLAGLVIGALGVLDDVTITQASAVWELQEANPRYGRLDLYRSAIRIGRDHIASTVNTLVLAYAGASLPLFLIFLQADLGLLDTINGEVVAVEIVRTLCGSIGLVAAVPLTTALAAVVAVGPVAGPRTEPAEGDAPVAGGEQGAGPDPDEAPVTESRSDDDSTPPSPAPPRRAAKRPSTNPDLFRSRAERRFWDE
jgi:uncharacterized membrane protein